MTVNNYTNLLGFLSITAAVTVLCDVTLTVIFDLRLILNSRSI